MEKKNFRHAEKKFSEVKRNSGEKKFSGENKFSGTKKHSDEKKFSDEKKKPDSGKFSGEKKSFERKEFSDRKRKASGGRIFAELISSLFDETKIPSEAKSVLENFDSVVQSVFPASSKQLLQVPEQIRDLSHELTDQRDQRRMGYMNNKIYLSAYIRYYMWWNLIRLTRLFSNIDFSVLNLSDEDVCLDMGSGPLTVVTALWLSRPELRNKKLVWYCMDLSHEALALGEELFLSVAAKTNVLAKSEIEPWKIIRVKGGLGQNINSKAKLVTCANMFNEVLQSDENPPDFLAKKYSESLLRYAEGKCGILVIEPGVPKSARFVSLLRDCFLRKEMSVVSPCAHSDVCPMDGRRQGKSGANGKWCNFAFNTDSAPSKLHKLSASAHIPKERAVLTFVFANSVNALKDEAGHGKKENEFLLRIASDEIRLPYGKTGFYACTEKGLMLVVNRSGKDLKSGTLLRIKGKIDFDGLEKDSKTNSLVIEI